MASPQSQQAINTLLAGGELGSGGHAVAPLEADARALLRVFVDHRDAMQTATGESQAKMLRQFFEEERDREPPSAPSSEASPQGPANPAEAPPWRLHKLTCQSIRGLVPYGQRLEFDFAGRSNLIYGPNGSGKSSLIAAVAWVLLGVPVTDADDPHAEDTAPIHAASDTGKGPKKADWPVMAALPDTAETAQAVPEYWSRLELREAEGARVLHLRRDAGGQLTASEDGETWGHCQDLAEHGISPLDLQLSLIAPTAFGRRTLEACEGTREVLSLMLGYDDLEQLGTLASNASRNCTRLYKSESKEIGDRKKQLRQKLTELPSMLSDRQPLYAELEALANLSDPSSKQIEEIGKKLKAAVEAAEKSLAELLGIDTGDEGPPADLDEKLILAVDTIERGVWSCFPSFSQQRVDVALPAREEASSEVQLQNLDSRLQAFVAGAAERIAARYEWWEKETAPESRVGLLLRAAQGYDPATEKCPVCEQSVSGLPVASELAKLKRVDPAFVQDGEVFFTRLVRELQDAVPAPLANLGDASPADRLRRDWQRLRHESVSADLATITDRYEPPMHELIVGLPPVDGHSPEVIPPDAQEAFVELAKELTEQVARAHRAVAVLRWSLNHMAEVRQDLEALITAPEGDRPSLLAELSKSKQAATNLRPLKNTLAQLRPLFKERQAIDQAEEQLATLTALREALGSLKGLGKYAQGEVRNVFGRIEQTTLENWNRLYEETPTGLSPGGLELGARRGQHVEAMLTREDGYHVPSQHFANAGLRRAVALAFYFALLDAHPGGLGFVLMDDPILSLDDEHRERWSDTILERWLERVQVVLATHQGEYVLRCGDTFTGEQRVSLNPRDRPARVTWQPLDCLQRAERLRETDWQAVPNVLRQHVEEVLWTLEAYSPTPFVDPHSLSQSLKRYRKLKSPNPVAGGQHDRIAEALSSQPVKRVVDEGSHRGGSASLSPALVRDCLNHLKKLEKGLQSEFDRLEQARRHRRRSGKTAALEPTLSIIPDAAGIEPLTLSVIGRAAAKADGCTIEEGAEATPLRFTGIVAVLVTGDSLEPVVGRGQWALLADADVLPEDGDLVAAQDGEGQRYLRRVWSDGGRWVLHAINPVRSLPAVTLSKQTPLRAVVGVLYDPVREPAGTQAEVWEWQPREEFEFGWPADVRLVRIEGDSLNPVARRGQYAVVAPSNPARGDQLTPGRLAAVDTSDPRTGQVIKCVYPGDDSWILTSCNPVETIPPLVVPVSQVKSVWPVYGVLFDGAVTEADKKTLTPQRVIR